MNSLYECVKCKEKFIAGHFAEVRLANGRTVKHCGLPARRIKDVELLSCYRVWFMDGSALQVDAESKKEAIDKAVHLALGQDFRRSYRSRTVKRVECLDEPERTVAELLKTGYQTVMPITRFMEGTK